MLKHAGTIAEHHTDVRRTQRGRESAGWSNYGCSLEPSGGCSRALDLAELLELHRAAAATEERARLSREMHDSLAQALSYLNLQSALVKQLLDRGEIDQARVGISDVVRTADEIYRDLRETLFRLRATLPSGTAFLPALRVYLEEYMTHYGLRVDLIVDDSPPPAIPERVAVQLSRIILEALANVRRHTKATAAQVRFEKEGDRTRITVEDKGQGFDVAGAGQAGQIHFGLQIMRERAESVGGALEVYSQLGRGTRVVATMPLV